MSDATKFIGRFEAFARSKPADERYSPYDGRTCALAQYGYPDIVFSMCGHLDVPEEAYWAATADGPATFGALADRLAKLREAAAKARGQS